MAPQTALFGVRNRYRHRMLNIIDVLSNSGPIWEPLRPHLASQNGAKIEPGASQTASRRLEGLRKASGIDFGQFFDRFSPILDGFSVVVTDVHRFLIDFRLFWGCKKPGMLLGALSRSSHNKELSEREFGSAGFPTLARVAAAAVLIHEVAR